jgi:hypothetical protein
MEPMRLIGWDWEMGQKGQKGMIDKIKLWLEIRLKNIKIKIKIKKNSSKSYLLQVI